MTAPPATSEAGPRRVPAAAESLFAYGLIGLAGCGLWLVSAWYPARMPAIGPYEFSWPIYLSVALTALWFRRGLARLPGGVAPGPWRQAAFWAGLAVIWIVTQTGFEYLAQRMFFTNRLQHVAMHHLGPLLLALSAGGPAVLAGGPGWLRRLCASRAAAVFMAAVQQPLVAAVLFVGLFWFWLIPPVHFRAMIDPALYRVMNASMILDGVLFWALVLDTRASPPARTRFGYRAALAMGVMFPQIVLGALISFATTDIFPYYAFCGRFFPTVSAITDQQIGGIVIWIPPAMMSIAGLILVIGNMRRAGADF